MPGKYGFTPQPKSSKSSLKAKGSIAKVLKEQDNYNMTHILDDLIPESYKLRSDSCGNMEQFLNKAEYHYCHTYKSLVRMEIKFKDTLLSILNDMPEYKAKVQEENSIREYQEYCLELGDTHYQYNNAQYAFDSNNYEVNQNRAMWKAMCYNIFDQSKNKNSQFFRTLYNTLKELNNVTINSDAKESISTFTHTSCWSYWINGQVTIGNEIISFKNVSYKEAQVNRV